MTGKAIARLLAGAALAAAGCGSSSTGPLSRADLAGKVNQACGSYAKAALAVPQPSDVAQNPASAASYLDKLRPLVIKEHAAIAALKPDAAARAEFERMRAASNHQLKLFEDAAAKAHAHNRRYLQDLQAAALYKQRVMVPMERKLGFTTCER